MKKVFMLALILGFIWALPAMAWQDPCTATQYTYEYDGYILGSWQEKKPEFSPAPECQGTVVLFAPDGMWYSYGYTGNRGILTIAEVLPCRVSDDGNLVCKIITQPEESTTLLLERK